MFYDDKIFSKFNLHSLRYVKKQYRKLPYGRRFRHKNYTSTSQFTSIIRPILGTKIPQCLSSHYLDSNHGYY